MHDRTIALTSWCSSRAERFLKRPDLIKSIDQRGGYQAITAVKMFIYRFMFMIKSAVIVEHL